MRGPSESISRAVSGAQSPLPSASAPAAAPAAPNEPVSALTSSTIASPLIPIGSRASSDAANRRPTCGVRRIWRYWRICPGTIRTRDEGDPGGAARGAGSGNGRGSGGALDKVAVVRVGAAHAPYSNPPPKRGLTPFT